MTPAAGFWIGAAFGIGGCLGFGLAAKSKPESSLGYYVRRGYSWLDFLMASLMVGLLTGCAGLFTESLLR